MIVNKILTDTEIKQRQGEFFDADYYHSIISEDMDVFTPDGNLLFSLRKKVIPKNISNIAVKNLKPYTMAAKSNCRGVATGKVNLNYMNDSIVELLDPGNFKTRVKYSDGHVSQYKISNTCKSTIAGYYDKPTLHDKKNNKYNNIRLTSFSEKYYTEWLNTIEYVQYLDQLYKLVFKDDYMDRKK